MDYQQQTLSGERESEQSRSYQGGSHANLIALQESVKHLTMSVTYGQKCGASLAKLSPDGLWLKMYQDYLQARMDGSFEEFSEILPAWGLMLGGELFQPRQLEPFIDETGWRLLPTPTANLNKGYSPATAKKMAGGGEKERQRSALRLLTRLDAGLLATLQSGHTEHCKPLITRDDDGFHVGLDRAKALGNAVVPQQFYPIFKAIAEIERSTPWSQRETT